MTKFLSCVSGVFTCCILIRCVLHKKMYVASRAPFQYKDRLSQVWIPMLMIRRSRDRLIFKMGIPILVRRHLYIETPPRFPQNVCYQCWKMLTMVPQLMNMMRSKCTLKTGLKWSPVFIPFDQHFIFTEHLCSKTCLPLIMCSSKVLIQALIEQYF